MLPRHFLTIILFTMAATAAAETYQSDDRQVQLLELYTSEGCSSCPPADHWLSKQKSSPGLWEKFVPVSFHVSYWNWIGWQDKFSNQQFDQRQRSYAHSGTLSNVYTPGFLLNGKEWRGFFEHHKALPKSPSAVVGNLQLKVEDDRFSASFTGDGATQLHIAILAMNVNSKVTRGENRNKTLTHDFVVVGYGHYGIGDEKQWSGKLPMIRHNASEYAIAAWVSGEESQQPIQALGGEFKPQ